MRLNEYVGLLDPLIRNPEQHAWFSRLKQKVTGGVADYGAHPDQQALLREFWNRVRTEELKAWYSAPDVDTLFQGTSVTSITVPCELREPLRLDGVEQLEESIADHYIALHRKHEKTVRKAIVEDVSSWMREGLFYSVLLSSKIISQAFQFKVKAQDVVFKIGGKTIDPHEILTYPQELRQRYFEAAKKRIDCFADCGITQQELESSLVLADISKPRIEEYADHLLLAPFRCNEIAAVLSSRVRDLIEAKSKGKIKPRSLAIIIYDSDTPYAYHHLMGHNGRDAAPILPGLTVLGSSGTIDALRWLYLYRISLVGQKIMKSSLYSEVHKRFMPFVYYGVLVQRDADILLQMGDLGRLRYRGNIDPAIEFHYLLDSLVEYRKNGRAADVPGNVSRRAR